ncbi:MAG: acetate--CoA ligase [Candidatus Aenigmatarchaeota archaeon]
MSEKGEQWIEKEGGIYWPSKKMKQKAIVSDPKIYEKANENPKGFWTEKAEELVDWFDEDWEETEEWNPPYFHWFRGAKTNLSYNCIDRHLEDKKDKPALIWEPELEEEERRVLTYGDLHEQVQKFANVLKDLGVEKDDAVTFWMPMIPETAVAALACQRIGAWHSIVFTAFSPQAVKQRMEDAGSEILITADGLYRRGKIIGLKEQLDEVLDEVGAKNCIVVDRAGENPEMKKGRDRYWSELMENADEKHEAAALDSEDIGFLLYTSGTTGKPKGIKHDIGGYMTQTALTMKWVFDFHEDDLFFSTADIGWITGHSYTLYGPLLLGGTTLWYEGSPDYPKADRWWKLIEKYEPDQFYTAPTALRMLRKEGPELPDRHDLSSLRILGSVGEPIDPNTWQWYFEKIGQRRCPIVDTYWQTETGGILLTSLPGIGPFVPGVAGLPLPSVDYEVVDWETEEVEEGQEGKLVQKHPFPPGMLRGVFKNPDKYKEEYWSEFGVETYFSGDGAKKTEIELEDMPLIKITGRVDDLMEVAGHRLGTAEIEDAVQHVEEVVEVAVVGKPHEIKGQVPAVFAILHKDEEGSDELKKKIVGKVREEVGPVATPGAIYFVDGLPSTESGKIIRRFLKSLLEDEELGDMTTAKNPECLGKLAEAVGYEGPQEIPGYSK